MIQAASLVVLASLTLSGLLRCCLPGELLHPWAFPRYEWVQLHRPSWMPEKWLLCVFCGSFWLVGIPLLLASVYWLHWWALAVPLPFAYLTEHLTHRLYADTRG